MDANGCSWKQVRYKLRQQTVKRNIRCKLFPWRRNFIDVVGRNDRLHKIVNTERLFNFYQKYQDLNLIFNTNVKSNYSAINMQRMKKRDFPQIHVQTHLIKKNMSMWWDGMW